MITLKETTSLPIPAGLNEQALLGFYRQMTLIRWFEQAVQKLYRAGEIPGFIHVYLGEEATAVGVMANLRREDWITSTHRGHGHALAKGVPSKIVMAELFGRATGCCGGRGGTMHLYAPRYGLFGTNGIVAAGIPLAVGLGISVKTRQTDQVVVAFFGDGATNHGAFHESINFAAVQNAPVVFVCENNLYATATPLSATTRNAEVASKAAAYGIPGVAVDGNDVLAMWQATHEAVKRARAGQGPTLIESKTYRTAGHHEGDPPVGTYRSQEEINAWALKCPILRLHNLLTESGLATADDLRVIEEEVEAEVTVAVEYARRSPKPDPSTVARHTWAEPINPSLPYASGQPSQTVVQGWLEAVRDGIAEEMRRDPHIIYIGEGIGERGGTFAHTKGLFEEFGPERVIETPISELGFTGASVSASATGCRAIADLMMADFLYEAGGQIVHQAAKLRYMSNGQINAPMIVRACMGTVKNAGPHHSGTYYPAWAHCPGLIVAVPSNPADAKGMIKTALRAGDPIVFMEHKSLLSTKGPVPTGEHYVPFGQAVVLREGTDLTIVSCGLWLHWCLTAAEQLAQKGVSCEVIDLRTIVPLDVDTIVASVSKTGKLLVVDEAYAMCGIGAEIAAAVMEHAFDELDAPVGRLHTEPVAIPFSPGLEEAAGTSVDKIVAAARAVLEGRLEAPRRAVGAVPSDIAPSAIAPQAAHAANIETAKLPELKRSPSGNSEQIRASTDGVSLIMPNMDLTITEATVVSWLKKAGEEVQTGENVVEMETDKAVVPVEAPVDGTLIEIVASEGTVVELGQILGTIRPS